MEDSRSSAVSTPSAAQVLGKLLRYVARRQSAWAAFAAEDLVEDAAELAVAVTDQEANVRV
jgi:hypothetical protein